MMNTLTEFLAVPMYVQGRPDDLPTVGQFQIYKVAR